MYSKAYFIKVWITLHRQRFSNLKYSNVKYSVFKGSISQISTTKSSITYSAPISGYACGTPALISLYCSGSARNSIGVSAMLPYTWAKRAMQADLCDMCRASADNISVFVHSGHLNFLRGVTWNEKYTIFKMCWGTVVSTFIYLN